MINKAEILYHGEDVTLVLIAILGTLLLLSTLLIPINPVVFLKIDIILIGLLLLLFTVLYGVEWTKRY